MRHNFLIIIIFNKYYTLRHNMPLHSDNMKCTAIVHKVVPSRVLTHSQDTGTELMPQDIKYYQQFGGEKVIFEKEETVEMKKLGTKGVYTQYLFYCVCIIHILHS